MPTLNQLIRQGREEKRRTDRTISVRRVLGLLSSIFLNFLLFPILLFSSKRITYPEELWASLLGPLALSFIVSFTLSSLFLFLIIKGSSLLSIYQLKRLDFSLIIFTIFVFALIVILLHPKAITIASCAPPAGGQMVPSSSGSGQASSEDSFGIDVLLEPWPIDRNSSLENSMRQRVLTLERAKSPFSPVLDNVKGKHWGEVRSHLNTATNQEDYSRILDFENRDLSIIEGKHRCYIELTKIISAYPYLAEKAGTHNDILEYLKIFFDNHYPATDREKILFLNQVASDLSQLGPESAYLDEILPV